MEEQWAACPKCAAGKRTAYANPQGSCSLRIALAGNPNSGKSTLFNALTAENQHTGNWPGKTVANKVGYFKSGEREIEVVDLPGTYSLSAYSAEEVIARDFLLEEKPDVVIVVLDEANLERNLYLAVQILELNLPAVVALNKGDVARDLGVSTDITRLSRSLHVPVVQTVATRRQGLERLVATVLSTAEKAAL